MVDRSWTKPLRWAVPSILSCVFLTANTWACPPQSHGDSPRVPLLLKTGPATPGSAEASASALARDLGLAMVQAESAAALASLPGTGIAARGIPSSSPPEPQSIPDSLTASQLQSLPLPQRDWESFVFDTPDQSASQGEDTGVNSQTGRRPPAVTVDGATMRLAFGDSATGHTRSHGSSFVGSVASEAAIREVQPAGAGNSLTSASFARANIVTERGSNRLHGQGSLFDRQGLWGARNPFTSWAQETSPATAITTPTFSAVPYSPDNHEWIWGLGAGGVLRRDRLFWFASLDSLQRNDPGVSMVKHPESFFAQPSNDQMQVLSARLGLSSANPVGAGLAAYSSMLETLDGLLGPAARTSSQWNGFGRLDWKAGERDNLSLEASGASVDSPGGGFSRASASYGTHSFGRNSANQTWLLGRWERFVTSNLLAVTQGSFGTQVQRATAETPSPYEQTLNINEWGQLPQIVVDSRYGFTIGNPARFGRGSYPDERLYHAQEQLNWVHGNLLLRGGFALDHNKDATTLLRNQTGTYYYSSVENFASDALAFAAFGINGQLDPMDQHNCDQTGRAWRDSTGTLHGLGYLPCYSYYSQTMGPTGWWLSTNDWSGYVTSQWQPKKLVVLTLALRWEREQLPPPLAVLSNHDLPLTQQSPALGNQWGPRAGLAFGSGQHHGPVFRLGYGMYFGRTPNATVQNVRTQTGSTKGDLSFFLRPTDNLKAGGAPPFPYVLAGEPSTVVKPGAVEFAPNFRNGEIHQAEASIEETLPGHLHLEASAVASLGRRLPVTLDTNIDPAVNPKTITYVVVDGNQSGPIKTPQITVPFYASWPSIYSATGFAGRLNANYQQVAEIFSRANSTYEAAMLRLVRSGRSLSLRIRYTYAHAMDWNPNESAQVSGSSVLDPTDFRQEYGTSNLDVRHSASVAAIWEPRWRFSKAADHFVNGWMLSGIGQFHSGLPYTMRTSGSLAKEFTVSGTPIVALAPGMNGYGGDSRVYGVGRNTYRYPGTWKADVRLGKRFNVGHERQLELMAESFNLFNHQNVTQLETVGYSIGSGSTNGSLPTLSFMTGLKPGSKQFGTPLNINATDNYRERQIEIGARVRF